MKNLDVGGLFIAALVACSCGPSGSGERTSAEVNGTVNVSLTAENSTVTYRLQKAELTIAEPLLHSSVVVKLAPDTTTYTETLPAGDYSAVLKDGWVLESKAADAEEFTTVSATLITPNPVTFTVTEGGVTNVAFGFSTSSGDVGLGAVDLHPSDQECAGFDGITASLATSTIECLGTIAPSSYAIGADGFLSRTFDSCPADQTKLQVIDGLLSIQRRGVRAPLAKACIGGRWAAWISQFDPNTPLPCPKFTKTSIVNDASSARIAQLASYLDNASRDSGAAASMDVRQDFDQGHSWSVQFTDGAGPPPNQMCHTAGDCAALCAGVFPGYVLSHDDTTIVTDGPYWLLDTTYPGSSYDPFFKPNYYHPMSYYGPPPGTQFAHRNRVTPCPGCRSETCSYGLSNIHIPLRCDCLDVANNATCPASDTSCVGMCAP